MKKIGIMIVGFILFTFIVGCSNGDDKGITNEKAEEIAMKQFERDVREYNTDADEEIKMNEFELLTDETNLDTQKKTWEVSFNYINGQTKKKVKTNAVAQYSINMKGEVIGKFLSFD
ncbi:hypothetical protein FZW96_14050 [Bacillus sp. BGMRC 2118]|nr:hypothetical protein FZW96_14050 [Bacillus sp. BGMRC 2118]